MDGLCGNAGEHKADSEKYFNQLDNNAEVGMNTNHLKEAYRAIRQISCKASTNHQCPINKVDGGPRESKD